MASGSDEGILGSPKRLAKHHSEASRPCNLPRTYCQDAGRHACAPPARFFSSPEFVRRRPAGLYLITPRFGRCWREGKSVTTKLACLTLLWRRWRRPRITLTETSRPRNTGDSGEGHCQSPPELPLWAVTCSGGYAQRCCSVVPRCLPGNIV